MLKNDRCATAGCSKSVRTRGWCNTHYEQLRRTGKIQLLPKPSFWDRFWSKVDASGDCWEWIGARKDNGYGHIVRPSGSMGLAHRVSWELLVGTIPDGLDIDHLCRNRSCVNPDHLEPVTRSENLRRGYVGGARTGFWREGPYAEGWTD